MIIEIISVCPIKIIPRVKGWSVIININDIIIFIVNINELISEISLIKYKFWRFKLYYSVYFWCLKSWLVFGLQDQYFELNYLN